MEPTESIWSAGLPPLSHRFLGRSLRVHTAVVGAGLAGLSAAYHLLKRRPDRPVVVLESCQVGAGASARSAGMVTPGIGQNLASLVRRMGRATARALYEETLRAVEYISCLVEHEGIDCQLHRTGQLIVARGRGGRARLAAQAQVLEELKLPCERLDAAALARTVRLANLLQPAGPTSHPAALRLPVAGILHPGLLLHGLARCIRERSGEIYEQARVVEISKDCPVIIRLADGGTVIADAVVLATAAYISEIGMFRGRILPVHLQALVTKPLEPAALQVLCWRNRECIIDSRRIFSYFRLTDDHRIVYGGGVPRYRWGGQTSDAPGAHASLDRLAVELHQTFPREARLQIAAGWTGVIGYVLDTLPAIQRLRDRPAVVHVGGWCGHGIALSVASGAWVAYLIDCGRPPMDVPWFREKPPLVPLELVRWLSFRVTVGMMSLMDWF